MIDDTIAAIATGMTNSGIGIIRISGEDAIKIADKIFKSKNEKSLEVANTHTIHYGWIYDKEKIIDEVLVSVMKKPNTYTRENVVEINCHGGITVVYKVFENIIKNGARPAEPGEFTKRAFLNGRIDLSQAEAVIDIINSKNEYALSSSVSQLRGSVSLKIKEIREIILNNIAFIEAALDDPEHINMDNYGDELMEIINDIIIKLEKLLNTSDNGRVIKEGIKTVIIGKPNAGKSSFLNAILGQERAIVTEVEGTTRDILEENININGISLNIIDTAGIRETDDVVEKIGVDKAKKIAEDADLIIYIVDTSKKFDDNDREIIEFIKDRKSIVLLNKTDLENKLEAADIKTLEKINTSNILKISAKNQTGIDIFEDTIKKLFFQGEVDFNDEIYITNARHKYCIMNALQSIKMVKESIENGMPEDFFTIDLMNGYEELGKIIGESVEDDLIDKIFSSFCMGK